MVVFVASFMLGAWISLLMYGSPPEWLGRTAFMWVAGGIVGVLIVAALVARRFFGD
jgi:vacuolar-type H+-ATPase subunit I/STV1